MTGTMAFHCPKPLLKHATLDPHTQVLLNKVALSSFQFRSPNALLFFQCALCVAAVQVSALAGLVKLEPLRAGMVRVWLPVNIIFVGMVGTSFWALASLNVGMVTGALLKEQTGVCRRPSALPVVPVKSFSSGHLLCAVLKNLTNLFTLGGDFWLYRRTYSWCANEQWLAGVWNSLAALQPANCTCR